MHQELNNVQYNTRRLNHQLSQIFWGIGVKLKKVRIHFRLNTTHLVGTFFLFTFYFHVYKSEI